MNPENIKEVMFDEKYLSLNEICDMDDTLSQTLVEEKFHNLSDDMKSRMNSKDAEKYLQSCRNELETSQAHLQSVEAMNSFLMDSIAIILYDLDAESNNFLNPEHITGIELIRDDEPLKSDILFHQEILKEPLFSHNKNGIREKIQDYKKNISALENSLEILENKLSKIEETNDTGVEQQEDIIKLNKAKVDILRKSRESAKELRHWKTDYYLDLNKTTKMFTRIQIEMHKAQRKHETETKVWQRKIERMKSLNTRAKNEYDRYEAKCKQQVHLSIQNETSICTASDEEIKFWLENKLARLFSFIDNKVFLEKIKNEYQNILNEMESLSNDTTEVNELILTKISNLNIELQYRFRQINDLETTITENTFEVLKKDICDKMQTQIESRLILQNLTKAMTELAKTFETSKLKLVKEKDECNQSKKTLEEAESEIAEIIAMLNEDVFEMKKFHPNRMMQKLSDKLSQRTAAAIASKTRTIGTASISYELGEVRLFEFGNSISSAKEQKRNLNYDSGSHSRAVGLHCQTRKGMIDARTRGIYTDEI